MASAIVTPKPASAVPWLEISVFVGVVILILAGFFFFTSSQNNAVLKDYPYTFHDASLDPQTWLVSKQAEPSEFTGRLNKSLKTVVLIRLSEDTATNTKMGQTLVLFQSLLPLLSKDQGIADQNLITLIEVYNQGALVDCTTDFGALSRKITLTPAECALFLSRSDQFVIEAAFPNPAQKINLIELEDHFVRIKTANPDAIPATALTLLKALNPKTPAFIQFVNNQIGTIGDSSPDQNLPGS